MNIELLLYIAAAAQLGIAILNLFIVRLLDWRPELDRMPLLLRQVFTVHAWFISLTLAIFAVITLRFAPEMAAGSAEVFRWFGACVGLFWGFRAILQVGYYSSSHWRGQPARLRAHVTLLILYGGFAAAYLCAAS
jgi:hypothetical protein